jgi:hypothetical protein
MREYVKKYQIKNLRYSTDRTNIRILLGDDVLECTESKHLFLNLSFDFTGRWK